MLELMEKIVCIGFIVFYYLGTFSILILSRIFSEEINDKKIKIYGYIMFIVCFVFVTLVLLGCIVSWW